LRVYAGNRAYSLCAWPAETSGGPLTVPGRSSYRSWGGTSLCYRSPPKHYAQPWVKSRVAGAAHTHHRHARTTRDCGAVLKARVGHTCWRNALETRPACPTAFHPVLVILGSAELFSSLHRTNRPPSSPAHVSALALATTLATRGGSFTSPLTVRRGRETLLQTNAEALISNHAPPNPVW